MSLIVADRVKETTSTTGTGDVTLGGAPRGFQAFSAVCSTGDEVWYCIAHRSTSEWEVGLGTWGAGASLSRDTVMASSNAGSLVEFSAGTKDVFQTNPAVRHSHIPAVSKQSAVVVIPNASVVTLHTTEVEIVAAVANVVLVPTFLIVKKLAGAYTVAGIPSNGLTLGYGTVADNIPCCPWGSNPAYSLLVESGEAIQFSYCLLHNGAGAGLPYSLSPGPVSSIVGKNLAMRTITASPQGAGGGALRVKCFYDEIPLAFLDI